MPQPIVDSHIHFWDPNLLRYDWLADVPQISQPTLPADLQAVSQGVELQGIVFVEADCHPSQVVDEARWVTALAQQETRIQAMVASAPLEAGEEARPVLEALSQIPLVKGIRRLLQSEPVGFGTQPNFVRGVQMLAEYDFSFDICIRHWQMEDAIALVAQCPEIEFVLDHFGKPGVKKGLMEPWATQLQQLAGYPNVRVKISGLATEADHANWNREQLRPYIQHALTTFGEDRVMYGGDWPVSKLAIGYQEWIDTINWATPDLSDAARHKLFVTNAQHFYKFSESPITQL
jgi:L-fuconolactonase